MYDDKKREFSLKKLEEMMQKFCDGIYLTDVVELKMRGLKIPVCNISCGYYNAHTSEEYTIFSELQHSLRFVKAIIERKSN